MRMNQLGNTDSGSASASRGEGRGRYHSCARTVSAGSRLAAGNPAHQLTPQLIGSIAPTLVFLAGQIRAEPRWLLSRAGDDSRLPIVDGHGQIGSGPLALRGDDRGDRQGSSRQVSGRPADRQANVLGRAVGVRWV